MHEIHKEVWDTGQLAHMNKHTGVDHEMADGAAFFGWCTVFLGTNAASDTLNWRVHDGQDMMGHDGPYQQHDGRGQLRADRGRPHRGESRHLTRQAGHQVGQQAGRAHRQQVRLIILQTGRPPEEFPGSEDVPGCEEICGCDDGPGGDDKDVYDDIALEISFRNKYEQKLSVLEGGGASLVVKCRLLAKQNIVSCCVTFRYSTWGEVPARTDTLVGQPPYQVRRGWGEVVPLGL